MCKFRTLLVTDSESLKETKYFDLGDGIFRTLDNKVYREDESALLTEREVFKSDKVFFEKLFHDLSVEIHKLGVQGKKKVGEINHFWDTAHKAVRAVMDNDIDVEIPEIVSDYDNSLNFSKGMEGLFSW